METNRAHATGAADESIFIEEYLTWLGEQKSRSPLTLESYRKDFYQFGHRLSEYYHAQGHLASIPSQLNLPIVGMDEYFLVVTPQVAQDYVDSLMDHKFSASTVSRKVTAIRGFYCHLKRRGRVNNNPFAYVYIPYTDSAKPEYLEETQLSRLLDSIECTNWLGYRDRAMVALLYNTGMRVGELIELTVKDIRLAEGCVLIHTRQRKSRECKLWAWVLDAVNQYIEQRKQRGLYEPLRTEKLFINRDSGSLTARSIRRRLKQYSRQAEMDIEVTPAVLRHSCAIHMLQDGASIKTVRAQLGHQSSSSIRPYLKIVKSLESSPNKTVVHQ